MGLSGKFGKDGDIWCLVKKLSALAFDPLNWRPWRTRNFRRSSRAKRWRFPPTSTQHIYGIGPVIRRRPLIEHEWRNAGPRVLTWIHRANNAIGIQRVLLF